LFGYFTKLREEKYFKLLLLLLLLLTAIELSLGGSSPYTGTDEINNNKYTYTKNTKTQYKQ